MNLHQVRVAALSFTLCSALALIALPMAAIEPPGDSTDETLTIQATAPMPQAKPSFELLDARSDKALTLHSMQDFYSEYSDDWTLGWDHRNERPEILSGVGFPLFADDPDKAGGLSAEAGARGGQMTLDNISRRLRGFIHRQNKMLRISNEDLQLDHSRSLAFGEGRHFWNVEFQQTHGGVPVEGAKVFFRINHGKVVQLGATRVAEVSIDPTPTIERTEALRMGLAQHALRTEEVDLIDRGSLKIIPMLDSDDSIGEKYLGPAGLGYQHVLVWEFSFVAADHHGYRLRMDAHSGELLELSDQTRFAEVKGNIYPVTNEPGTLISAGLPFASVTNGTTKITDANGNYNYSGGTATVTLNGRYTRMVDTCGSISLSSSTDGNIDFGGAGGTDCTTPGFGGSGNTHSSRSGFFHLTNINRKAATFLPGNTWLDGTLTANMNLNSNCNAFWNGSTVNFFTSGGGCGNTGEIAGVFLHEWGHGMDSNAGGNTGDQGTGEALGDSFAFIELRDPCIGNRFDSTPCYNCNNSCTGVRDVAAFGVNGISTVSRPDTVTDNNGIDCDRILGLNNSTCPYFRPDNGQPYQGVMGYEGHCESYIASSANWDLSQSLVATHGTEAGWAAMEKIWYASLTPMGDAYQIVSGGRCNPNANINGCGSENWYTLYLAADDDDGNLANGTPNACRIWDAFDAHGIACGTRPACSSTCTPAPQADAGSDQTVCSGASTTLGTPAQVGTTYSWSPGGATTAQITVSPTTTTTYTVTATTSCGTAQDSVTVTVDDGSGGGLSDDFEGGIGSWTTGGLWHLVNNSSCASPGYSSASRALYYGQDSGCNYNTGAATTGDLISPVISGINSSSNLSFDYFRQVETFSGGSFDQTEVAVSPTGSSTWTTIWSRDSGDASANAWTPSGTISLSSFAGQDVQVRFRFNSVDTTANNFTGWFVDDVVVTADSSCGGPPPNTAPTVSISAPANGSSSDQGQSVTFTGSANDSEDGNLSASLSWSSSLDGPLGSGASISTSSLSVGTHTVTASVTDSGSLSDSDSISITVNQAGAVAQTATFDATLQAPKCGVVGISCTSAGLLDGRGTKGPEPNQPNTINDSCADGGSGNYHVDESLDALKVSTTDGSAFAAGKTVTIEATVYAWQTGSSDHLDLYFAADANNPSWTFIGTVDPTAGGTQTLTSNYTLPAGTLQAIRGRFRYNGSAGPCTTGNYDDHDDRIFAVNP